MPHDERVTLSQIADACARIIEATSDLTEDQYDASWVLSSAIERQFMILGEAFVRLRTIGSPAYDELTDARRIVGFRNLLAHGYDAVDTKQVLLICRIDVPALLGEIERKLSS